jgi:hypothetical protein
MIRKGCSYRCASFLLALVGWSGLVAAQASDKGWEGTEDQVYRTNFIQAFGQPSDRFSSMSEYLDYFDYDRYLGNTLSTALAEMQLGSRPVMWSMDYWMISMNEAYHATGDPYYLEENHRCIRAVLDYRDDRRSAMLYDGTVAPVWGTDIYSEGNGRRYYSGHSGMITFPMLEFLLLAQKEPGLLETLGEEYDEILDLVQETLEFHSRDWVDGPGAEEGHFINHPDSEHRLQYQNQPQPANLMCAMGRALWMSYKVSGNFTHLTRAVKLARYIKNRLTLATDGAYYWEYQLPTQPVTETRDKEEILSEDVGHAFLTISFPILLAQEGVVFGDVDMIRFSKTLKQGFGRLGDGVLLGEVNGSPLRFDTVNEIRGSVIGIFGWARLTPWDPEVYQQVSEFYLKYHANSDNHIDNAVLMRYNLEVSAVTPTPTTGPSSTTTPIPTATASSTATWTHSPTLTNTPSITPTHTFAVVPTFSSTSTSTPTAIPIPNPFFEFSLGWFRGEPAISSRELLDLLALYRDLSGP